MTPAKKVDMYSDHQFGTKLGLMTQIQMKDIIISMRQSQRNFAIKLEKKTHRSTQELHLLQHA